jgi:hypothetical protein
VLSLDDPRWAQYQANYTDGGHVATLLVRAEAGEPLGTWYEDLFQELCHQYTVSEAAFPAAPHLARLAAAREDGRLELLILLGACHTSAEPAKVAQFSADIAQGWRASAREAIPLIADLLASPQVDQTELRYLMSALAAVRGYPALASAIERLDAELE